MIKRILDSILSFFGLICLFPVFILIAIWIKLDSPGPIFFRQSRVGQFGKAFYIHKFRTMDVGTEGMGRLTIAGDTRITQSGKFIRKYKIDELPQLIDVLFGKMSLVGPRPEVQEFINYYPEEIKKKVLSIKPGITDFASIMMIDENSIIAQYEDPHQAYIDIILPMKQRYYLEYIETQNIFKDLYIIMLTLIKIIKRN
ncbi:glycosyl transferase [Colwellia sp. 75C3]|uniref:sugar transferase n=1 Tax=Colwellia sp. 75C3 TaxID=888425 RepID=UPI000C32D2A8|nr:sugar transferase [Colwellia sp. 75C3]PKG84475.1 glycosyl transferase [Colwellia sp. 75C3]